MTLRYVKFDTITHGLHCCRLHIKCFLMFNDLNGQAVLLWHLERVSLWEQPPYSSDWYCSYYGNSFNGGKFRHAWSEKLAAVSK